MSPIKIIILGTVGCIVLAIIHYFFDKRRWWVNGLGQDWSVVLDSYSIFLYLGVCASIVSHCSNSYSSIFISDVDKKMIEMYD